MSFRGRRRFRLSSRYRHPGNVREYYSRLRSSMNLKKVNGTRRECFIYEPENSITSARFIFRELFRKSFFNDATFAVKDLRLRFYIFDKVSLRRI